MPTIAHLAHPLVRPAWTLLDPGAEEPLVPSGFADLDAALGGGLPPADLVELCAPVGAGGLTLALALGERLAAAAGRGAAGLAGRATVVVDPAGRAAAEDLVLPGRAWPAGAVLVRPRDGREGLAVLDRALRCAGVACAVGRLDLGRRRLGLAETARLRQAARAGRTAAFLVREATRGGLGPSAAPVRLAVRRVGAPGAEERLEVRVLRVRGFPGAGEGVALVV